VRRDTPQVRRTRHRGTVVTGGMCCHTAPRSFVIESKNSIRCTSRFEGANLLKIFAFKKQ
jgi:hypothetical protein